MRVNEFYVTGIIMTLDQKILNALKRRPMLTRELVGELNEDKRKIYYYCRKLERHGSIKSELVKGRRLLYCVNHEKVVTQKIFNTCRKEGHELRFFYINERLWSLP